MAITQAITCDQCGKVKGDVNHWWLYSFSGAFTAEPWGDKAEIFKHACGQECLTKALNEFMQSVQK